MNCRICDCKSFESIIDLGNMAYTGIFPKNNENVPYGRLSLIKCDNCQLIQLEDKFDPKELYLGDYGYRSSLNLSMVNHLQDIVIEIEKTVDFKYNDIIIDIGSNDATLLRLYNHYTKSLCKFIGIDPNPKFEKYYNGIEFIPKFFNGIDKKAKVITSIAVLYDIERPLEFVNNIYNSLDDDGIWAFEQSYMPTMLSQGTYDTICHEHFEYYGLSQIKYMLNMVGFNIIHISFNNTNGGSFFVICCKDRAYYLHARTGLLIEAEKNIISNNINEFPGRVQKNKYNLIELINKINKQGGKVYGYGASTKGNVILQYCEFTEKEIPCILEINEDKFNTRTPGTNIPILPYEKTIKENPDYLLVLPWHFKESIIKKEKEFKGKFIFPLPEIEII